MIGAVTDASGIDVALPSGPAADAAWPAGVWTVSLEVTRPGEPRPRTSNVAAVLLAPSLDLPPGVARDAGTGAVTVTLDVHPQVRPSQAAVLALSGDTAVADAHPTTTGTLTFRFGDLPAGVRRVRLTVDGVESRLVDRSVTPPAFAPGQTVSVPA